MNSRVYFDHLDSLRFYAFLVVFVAHAGIIFPISADWFYWLYRHVISHGSYGVNFFFVLSGFLITFLLLREKKNKGTLSIKNFYLKRVYRIWPVYFIVFILSIFILPAIVRYLGAEHIHGETRTFVNLNMGTDTSVFWFFFFFLGNFAQALQIGSIPFALGVLWSVSVEEQFYLVWPLITRFCKERLLFYVSLILIGASFLYKAIHINDANIAYYSTLSVTMDLAFGCALGVMFFRYESFIKRTYIQVRMKWVNLFNLATGRKEYAGKGNLIVATRELIKTSNSVQKKILGKTKELSMREKSDRLIISLLCIFILSITAFNIAYIISTPGLMYDFARLMKRPVIDVLFVGILLFSLLIDAPKNTETKGVAIKDTPEVHPAAEVDGTAKKPRIGFAASFTTTYLGKISYGLYAYHAICMIFVVSIFSYFGTTPNNVSVVQFALIFSISFFLTVYLSHKSYTYLESRVLALKNKLK